MTYIIPTQLSQNSLPRRLQQPERVNAAAAGRQDNPAPQRERTASPQPESLKKDLRAHQIETKYTRSQKRSRPKRKTVQVILWVKPGVKAELQRIAEQEGLSVSATGAAYLESALQQNLHTQHAALIDPIIEKAIGKHMRAYSNRLAVLLVRDLVTTEMIYDIATNILGRQTGMDEKTLQHILSSAQDKARAKITRITPQMKTLIDAVKTLFETQEKGGSINA